MTCYRSKIFYSGKFISNAIFSYIVIPCFIYNFLKLHIFQVALLYSIVNLIPMKKKNNYFRRLAMIVRTSRWVFWNQKEPLTNQRKNGSRSFFWTHWGIFFFWTSWGRTLHKKSTTAAMQEGFEFPKARTWLKSDIKPGSVTPWIIENASRDFYAKLICALTLPIWRRDMGSVNSSFGSWSGSAHWPRR